MPLSPASPLLTAPREAHRASMPGDVTHAAMPAPYTELDPALERNARVAQHYFDEINHYAEDTHPDSVRMLEARRPQSLPPTYWQATGKHSPLPEHVEDNERRGSGERPLMFDPSLSGRALMQACKHVSRLDDLLEKAEQLGMLLLEREQQGASATSLNVNAVASLCQKIDRLKSCWASGMFAGSSRVLGHLASTCVPVYRAERETMLKDSIEQLWNVARTEYQEKYLPDPVNADPVLPRVFLMVKDLKNAEI